MYEAFFGLSGPPFQLNPDPAFYFNSRGHGHALAYLRYGVAQGEGFIVVTGEIGAGKTTLVRTLLGELDRQQVVAAQIVSTQLDSGDLLQSIITAFGIPAQGASKAYMIATLEAFLTTLAAQGRRALLIVDEAQNLNPGAVEELRMLSNFQLGNHSLLQSFLIGQPELRRILELPTMEQLRQRVSASCHLGPLDAEETRAYIAHRLQRVGWNGRPPISDAAYAELYRWSGGVPRRINRLANRVLLATFLEGRAEVDATLVEATARELRGEIGEVGAEPAPVATLAPLAQPPAAAGGAPAALASPVSSTVPPSAFAPALEEAGPAALADDEALDAAAAQAGTELSASDTADALADADLDAETTALLSDPDLLLALAVADEITAESPDEAADQAWAADGNEAPSPAVVDDAPRWAGMLPSAAARRCDLLVLVDGAADALAAAALLQALTGTDATAAEAPEVVLVSVGPASEVWPWEEFERLLRRPASLHLGLDTAAGFEALLAPLVERLGPALDELQPRAALVLGAGDAVLAAALLLHKRGLPLCQLAGHALLTGPAESANEAVLAALSQVTPSQSAHPTVSARTALAAALVSALRAPLAGRLLADACHALEPGITTPTGACLRQNLSIYLGPDWSEQVQGTPYAALALGLPEDDAACRLRLDQLLACTAVPKLLWLLDARTERRLLRWLGEDAAPDQATAVFLVDDQLSREDSNYRSRYHRAQIVARRVDSLTDQLALLRGGLVLISEAGQLLAEVAALSGLPLALLDGQGQWVEGGQLQQAGSAEPAGRVADVSRVHAAEGLDAWLAGHVSSGYAARAAQAAIQAAAQSAQTRLGGAASPWQVAPGAAATLAERLRPWLQAVGVQVVTTPA